MVERHVSDLSSYGRERRGEERAARTSYLFRFSAHVGRSVGYECPKAAATLVLATVNVNILRSPH